MVKVSKTNLKDFIEKHLSEAIKNNGSRKATIEEIISLTFNEAMLDQLEQSESNLNFKNQQKSNLASKTSDPASKTSEKEKTADLESDVIDFFKDLVKNLKLDKRNDNLYRSCIETLFQQFKVELENHLESLSLFQPSINALFKDTPFYQKEKVVEEYVKTLHFE